MLETIVLLQPWCEHLPIQVHYVSNGDKVSTWGDLERSSTDSETWLLIVVCPSWQSSTLGAPSTTPNCAWASRVYFIRLKVVCTVASIKVIVSLYHSCRNLHICHGIFWYWMTQGNNTTPSLCRNIGRNPPLAAMHHLLCRIPRCSLEPDAVRMSLLCHQLALNAKCQTSFALRIFFICSNQYSKLSCGPETLGVNTIWSVIIALACEWCEGYMFLVN